MADYQTTRQEQEDNISLATQAPDARPGNSDHRPTDRLSRYSDRFLDRADNVVYAAVGICFLLAAIVALIYTFWAFGLGVLELRSIPIDLRPGQLAQVVIEFVSGLLLVLIIIEMLSTVVHYLQVHATSSQPFLFIGIVSATRSILSVGARLSVEGFNLSSADFTRAMVELGVSAAVILALGITLKLLGRLGPAGDSL